MEEEKMVLVAMCVRKEFSVRTAITIVSRRVATGMAALSA